MFVGRSGLILRQYDKREWWKYCRTHLHRHHKVMHQSATILVHTKKKNLSRCLHLYFHGAGISFERSDVCFFCRFWARALYFLDAFSVVTWVGFAVSKWHLATETFQGDAQRLQCRILSPPLSHSSGQNLFLVWHQYYQQYQHSRLELVAIIRQNTCQ